jgi:hypothetical protein
MTSTMVNARPEEHKGAWSSASSALTTASLGTIGSNAGVNLFLLKFGKGIMVLFLAGGAGGSEEES